MDIRKVLGLPIGNLKLNSMTLLMSEAAWFKSLAEYEPWRLVVSPGERKVPMEPMIG